MDISILKDNQEAIEAEYRKRKEEYEIAARERAIFEADVLRIIGDIIGESPESVKSYAVRNEKIVLPLAEGISLDLNKYMSDEHYHEEVKKVIYNTIYKLQNDYLNGNFENDRAISV